MKITIVLLAFYFIYEKLNNNNLLTTSELKEQLSILFSNDISLIIVALLLTDANWFAEILKWQKLTSNLKKISFLESFEQCLASLSVSIITPNRIGEYGAKALFFKKEHRKKIMLLNLIGNLSQLFVTVIFGIVGLLFLMKNFRFETPEINYLPLILIVVSAILIVLFRKQLRLHEISVFVKNISSKSYLNIIGFSLFRYLFFSHQFYFLLKLLGVETDYFTLMYLIFSTYFLASMIPSLAIFDWAIKGSIAIWLFSFIGLNELTVVTVTTIMWLLNFAIPSIIGSFFVLNFKLILEE